MAVAGIGEKVAMPLSEVLNEVPLFSYVFRITRVSLIGR
jgi:hypothetical protein